MDKNTKINENLKLNDNPFEEQKYLKVDSTIEDKTKKVKKSSISLNSLKKTSSNKKKTVKKQLLPFDIFENITILSKYDLTFSDIKYYTSPLCQNIKNDDSIKNEGSIKNDDSIKNEGSEIYKIHYKAFLTSLRSVFLNYKKFNEFFVIKISDGSLIYFYENKILATNKVSKLLKSNDIAFIKTKDYLVINDNINIVMDMISNVDFETIPYILSYTEFEYLTVRYTKIELSKVVKSLNEKEFYYEISGIVYFGDSKFYSNIKELKDECKVTIKTGIKINYT